MSSRKYLKASSKNGNGTAEVSDAVLVKNTASVTGKIRPGKLEDFDPNHEDVSINNSELLRILTEVKNGNFSVRMPIDQVGINNRYTVGVDRMMWMCDFPHSVSNWPIDVELAHAQLKAGGVPPDEWERLMWRTVADLYEIPYELPAATGERIAAE